MKNPNSPTRSWLDSIATGRNGYDVDAESGDSGTTTVEREGTEYEVTVRVPDTEGDTEA